MFKFATIKHNILIIFRNFVCLFVCRFAINYSYIKFNILNYVFKHFLPILSLFSNFILIRHIFYIFYYPILFAPFLPTPLSSTPCLSTHDVGHMQLPGVSHQPLRLVARTSQLQNQDRFTTSWYDQRSLYFFSCRAVHFWQSRSAKKRVTWSPGSEFLDNLGDLVTCALEKVKKEVPVWVLEEMWRNQLMSNFSEWSREGFLWFK